MKAANELQLAELKKANEAQLSAMKEAHNDSLEALKESQSTQLESVKEANENRLNALKESNSAELENLKDSQSSQLEAMKEAQTNQLNAVKTANENRLKALKDSQQKSLKSLKESQQDRLSALKKQNETELKDLKKKLKAEQEAAEQGVGNLAQLAVAAGLAGQRGIAGFLAIMNMTDEEFEKYLMTVDSAGFSIQDFYEKMAESGHPTDVMKESLEKLGISTDEFDKALMLANGDADEFVKTLMGYSDTGATYEEVLGSMGISLEDLQEQMKNTDGTAKQMADTMNDSAEGDMKLLTSAMEELQLTIMDHLMPAIREIIQKVTDLFGWFTNLDEGVQRAIITIGGIVAAVGPVMTAIGGLSAAISYLAANPIVAVIAGIGALVGGLVTLYNTNEDFRNKVNAVWNFVKKLIGDTVDKIAGFIRSFIDKVMEIPKAWEDIKTTVSDAAKKMAEGVKKWWEGIPEWFEDKWKAITENETLKKLGGAIEGFFKDPWNAITGPNGIWTKVTTWFDDKWKSIIESKKLKEILGAITSPFKNAYNAILGKDGILAKLREGVFTVIDRVKKLFNFEWKFPKPKMPHFQVSWVPYGPISLPHVEVEWYKKAMDNAMLLSNPMIFGMMGNKFLGGGEAGNEVVAGADKLMTMIQSAVAQTMEHMRYASMMTSAVNPVMSSYATGAYDDATGRTIIAMLSRYLPYLPEVANMKMVTDTGALVGQLAPKMDKELGVISQRARRQ